MKITEKFRDELDTKIHDLEDFISRNGIGSSQLTKAKKAQRNANIALIAIGALAVVGLVSWMSSSDDD